MVHANDRKWKTSAQAHKPLVTVQLGPKNLAFQFTCLFTVGDHTEIQELEPAFNTDYDLCKNLVRSVWETIAQQDDRYEDQYKGQSEKTWIEAKQGHLEFHFYFILDSNVPMDPDHVRLGVQWLKGHADVKG